MPLSLCHLDGTICKTDKSALLKCLEHEVKDPALPSHTDIILIDGFFYLLLLKDVPQTFGNISKQILKNIVKMNGKRVALIFDRYKSPSIKDNEHSIRNTYEKCDFHISGEEQSRPADFAKELRNIKFKEALVNFRISHWSRSDVYVTVFRK